MIEIKSKLTTAPVAKIKKIIRDGQKQPEPQNLVDNKDAKDEEEGIGETDPQHIDEIV